MKKIFSVCFLILMIFAISVTANALQEEVLIFNGEITVHVPPSYYSLEKDIPEDSEKLKELGITKDEFLVMLEDAEHLLTTKDLETQIYIYCEKTSYIPFEFFTEREKVEYISELRKSYKESGYEVLDAEMIYAYDTEYSKILIAGSDDYVPMIIYNTVFKGLDLTVILYNFGDGEISYVQDWTIDSVIRELEFNTNNYALKNTVPVKYTVYGIGTEFTLPKGWYVAENSNGEFMAIKSKNVAMMYFSYDAWDVFTEEEKSQMHRSDLNTDLFTKEDLKELIESKEMQEKYLSYGLSIVEDSARIEKCGEYDCVLLQLEPTSDSFIFKDMTAFMYLENGIFHAFIFTGPFEGKTAEELQGIVASAKFPEFPDEGEEINGSDIISGIFIETLRYGIFASIFYAIFAAIKKIIRKNKKKESDGDAVPFVSEESKENKFCRECGVQLYEGDKFCPLCGTKVK